MVGLFQLTVHLYFKKTSVMVIFTEYIQKRFTFPNWLSLVTCYVHINIILSSFNDWKPRNFIIIETETHIFTRVIEYDKNRTKDKKNNIVVLFLKVLVSISDHGTL
jgi:hypothetical protein